jgi:hypothetical protein
MNPDKEELVRKSGKRPHYAPVRRREEEAALQLWSVCAYRAGSRAVFIQAWGQNRRGLSLKV